MPRSLTAVTSDEPEGIVTEPGDAASEPTPLKAVPMPEPVAAPPPRRSRRPRARTAAGHTLPDSLERVLKNVERVRDGSDRDAVHDLRVALRRCRVVATTLAGLDPDPSWKELRREARPLFRALGALRDVQILEEWVNALTALDDPLRQELVDSLRTRTSEPHASATEAVEAFDRKAWKRLARRLSGRAAIVRPGGTAAQCLALERLTEVRRLHVRAVRAETAHDWHQLRIALKRFRYVVESLLPARYAAWEASLKSIQDALGKLHDLQVLDAFVRETAGAEGAKTMALRATIDAECLACIERYRREADVLLEWGKALPRGARVEAAVEARFRATARALDPHPGRTTSVTRLALGLFDALAASDADERFHDARARAILRGAGHLHRVRLRGERRARHKAAADIVRALSVPAGWKLAELKTLALTVRYHRGAEPSATHEEFASLTAERQRCVSLLAGVLRFARALHKAGASHVDSTPQPDFRLRASGIDDTRKNAARLASGKHLLEVTLGREIPLEKTAPPAP